MDTSILHCSFAEKGKKIEKKVQSLGEILDGEACRTVEPTEGIGGTSSVVLKNLYVNDWQQLDMKTLD